MSLTIISDENVTSSPRRKTDAESFADGDIAKALNHLQIKSGDRTEETSEATLRLNINEVSSILRSVAPAKVEKKEKRLVKGLADQLVNCYRFPCVKCKLPSRGILRGVRRSVPNKLHIIQYWRKQLNNKIHRKKHAILVDSNADMNITYQELDEFSNTIAYHLKNMKFTGNYENENPNGECIICMVLPPCYEYIVFLLAIWKLGAAFLPISYDLPPERIADIIRLTRPVLTIVANADDPVFAQVVRLVQFDMMHIDEIWNLMLQGVVGKSLATFKDPIQSPDPTKPYPPMWKRSVVVAVTPSDIHELQAVSYDSKAILNRIEWENHFFVYFSSEYVLLPPTFDSIDSIADIVTPLCVGATLIILESPRDYLIPDQLFFFCHTYKIRRLTLWPALLKACCTAMQLFEDLLHQVNTVRYWFCVGGFMRTELADMFFELAPPFAQLVHMYGHEDCLGALSFQIYECGNSQSQNFYSRLPVGYPVPNTDIYVLDADLNPVKDECVGEVYVSGLTLPRIAKENLDKLDSRYYMLNPFSKKKGYQIMMKTMDIGRITTKTNGSRILVHEMTRARHFFVENQVVWLLHVSMYLERMPQLVKASHILCYRPNEDEQMLLAFCVLASPTCTAAEVEEDLKNSLPLSMIPDIVVIDEIPKLPQSGHPDENQLLQLYQDLRSARKVFSKWNSIPSLHANPNMLRAAKILSYVLFTYLGVPISLIMETFWDKPYLMMTRATITKGCFIVKELHRNRYPVFIDDLINAATLLEFAERMVDARKERGFCNTSNPADEVLFIKHRYKLDVMVNNNRVSVCGILARCFTQRDQLDYYAEVSTAHLRKFFDAMWPIFVSKKLSIIIRKKKEMKQLVGAVLNMSWHDEMQFTKNSVPQDIFYKLELIQYLESGLTDSHFPQNKTHVLQVCYIGLDSSTLPSYEIHGLTDKIVRCMMVFAKVRGFQALVIIAYDFFCLDLLVNSYHFHVAKECQVNQFVASDDLRPYALCPDSMIATLCWKLLYTVHETNPKSRKSQSKKRKSMLNDHAKPWNS